MLKWLCSALGQTPKGLQKQETPTTNTEQNIKTKQNNNKNSYEVNWSEHAQEFVLIKCVLLKD